MWYVLGLISMVLVLICLVAILFISGIVWLAGEEEMVELYSSEVDSSNLRIVVWDAFILTSFLLSSSLIALHIWLISLPRHKEL